MNSDPAPRIANDYGLSVSGIVRHKANCRPTAIATALPGRSRVDVMANLLLMADDALRLQEKAERARSYMAAVAALGKRKDLIEAMHELQGPAEQPPLAKHPEFIAFRDRLLASFAAHPEAMRLLLAACTPDTRGDT